MSEEKITHKELLTFSNLPNLEWEFVDLVAIKERQHDSIDGEVSSGDSYSTQLNDLLAPENFVGEETDPETGKKGQLLYTANEKKA